MIKCKKGVDYMQIVILDGYTLNPGDLSWDSLANLGDVQIYDRTKPEELHERIRDADIILLNKVKLNKEAIEITKAKYIGVLATGYDVVDITAAKEQGIIVTNVPTYGTYSVAQLTFSHILNIFSNVSIHVDSVSKGEWQTNPDWTYWKSDLTELAGKTLGIIGYGRIGQTVGNIAEAFGMKVLAIRTSRNKSNDKKFIGLDELLSKSDIISLHCPLTTETSNIINKDNISKMKDGVVIINTSRGGLVNEQDLANGLNSGKIKAAGIDVVSVEPIMENNPLLSSKNTFITPHISWATKEARIKLMDIVIDNLKSYIDNNPKNIVN